MTENQKSAGKKRKTDSKGRFVPGHCGGPGRPKGEPNTVARALRGQWADRAEEIAKKVLEQALNGDLDACKVILDRLYPRPKDGPAFLDLPSLEGASDLPRATAAVLQAMAQGELTPSEAATVVSSLAGHGKLVELAELEKRLSKLEEQAGD